MWNMIDFDLYNSWDAFIHKEKNNPNQENAC